MSSVSARSFKASYDLAAKAISAAVFLLLLAIAALTHSIVAVSLGILLFVAAYVWSPSDYSVSPGWLMIRRPIGNVRIANESIRDIRVAVAEDFRGCIRLFGSGGLFGYYGLFRTPKLGKSTWYVTNRSHAVVVVSDSGTTVLSPDDISGFITAIRESASVPPTPATETVAGPAMFSSIGTDSATYGAGRKIAGISTVGAVLAVVSWSLLYAPGPPVCTLTQQSLTIHDRFYPCTVNADNVDVPHIRVVDFDNDTGWKPVERTDGFGNAHYHSGWFRVASGQIVRMYRADSERMVLLPAKGSGTPVLLEVKDPEKFASEVRERWGSPSIAAP